MNDQIVPGAGGTEPEAGANGADVPPILIGAQYIKDLSFENPQGSDLVHTLDQNPDVNIEINTNARPLGGDLHEVSLFMRSEAKVAGKPIFIVELTYAGVAQVNGVSEEDLEPMLLIEVPRHLFPFARGVIANVTRDGGFPPLMINPVDFTLLYMQQQQQQAGAAPEAE